MSPLSQLGESLSPGGNIDRKFSPFFNFLDEFDRHFSHRHRQSASDHAFVPRFDLEEDAHAYFLTGELAGATSADVEIEAGGNDRTIVIEGTIKGGKGQAKAYGADGNVEILEGGLGYVDADLHTGEHAKEEENATGPTKINDGKPDRKLILRERLTGDFHRTFTFPKAILEDGVKASVENGILYLVVPKKEVVKGVKKGKSIVVGRGVL